VIYKKDPLWSSQRACRPTRISEAGHRPADRDQRQPATTQYFHLNYK